MTEHLPTTNGDGLPVIPMTEEQKYAFDLKGWICLPGLLSEQDLKPIRVHQMKFLNDRESLPAEQRDNHGGPSQALLDHPAVVGVLNEILSHQALATEDCYGFRYDHTYTSYREAGHDNYSPHGGGGYFNFEGNSHIYQMLPGRVHSGLTRVLWELNEVREGDGGTLLLSGSHKAAFPRPESLSGRDSELWESYVCPAGSALIFTEALCHSGTRWTNTHWPRLSLFTCYNTVNAKWGKGRPTDEVIDAMSPKRQTLFRGVWHGMNEVPGVNRYCDPANTAV
ncbi:MAG: phytanoyl-CoA dioxygenase family protein [Candidatus Latescibacterota bacterium]|nr:phytanoyl-CoA dioxygenase family protein [Candidatus Latescibacterota bacterium]